ncbi:hypothetical protein [Actinokineospora spheciospongiae]|uniref:hypothetical protein n=1 Tax=Actinokineospora spheciospongiae TaxID=909613 RepID=UPI000D70B1D3|nr:hypothetical protein [Actinokineospora spheciospongiae]PWW64451.1 hypothetical protein DFQ13_103425 [Actinokineospora spheciospongiae]
MGWWNQPRDSAGRWTKGGAGVVVIGAAGALVLSGGTGAGVGGLGTEAAGAADSVSVQARNSSRKTKSDSEWKRLRLRKVREDVENALDCAANSYGQVRDFFLRNPCKSLDRTLITLADPSGGTFVVSVSWVRMRAKNDVRPLKDLIDTDGTGSVHALGWPLLKSRGVRFTGTPFRSRPTGDHLVIAEGAVVSGHPDQALYTASVEAAALLPA